MEQIRKYFEEAYQIKEQDWQIFSSKLTKQKFPKKTTILSVGQIEKYLSFIEEGIIRFYIPKEDNDLTFGFIFKDSFCFF